MKLLFDENLSPSLVRRLADLFPNSAHVHHSDLGRADDATILSFARDQDYVVVTKRCRSRVRAIEALADDETGIIDIL